MKPFSVLLLAAASALLVNASCSSSDKSSNNADAGPAGGPVPGAADDHCTGTPTVVDPAACTGTSTDTAAGGAADGDTSGSSSAGAADCTQTRDAEYGATLSNSEGDDDDCKYHASWTSTPIRLNEDVTFTLTTTNKTTMMPLTPLGDGDIPLSRVDVYVPCDPNHLGPTQNFKPQIAQTMPGQFTVGPIKFDESGLWVVRFHLYEECNDTDTSPHGHIAFFVNVP